MVADSLHSDAALLRATVSWWEAAGVDVLVDDTPRNWLESPAPPIFVDSPTPRQSTVAAPAEPARPATLDALIGHLLQSPDLTEAGPPEHRIAASGDADAPLIVMIDRPDEGDAARGTLLSGESGRLFDAMLAAMGKSRADCYIAALCPGVPAGGIIRADALPAYAALARDHLALAGAEEALVLGQATIRAILGADALPHGEGLQLFNHLGRKKVVAAAHAPHFLLRQPKQKAQVWAALQKLMTGNKA